MVSCTNKPPTPCLRQAFASTPQKTKRKTRPAIRRGARWREPTTEGRAVEGTLLIKGRRHGPDKNAKFTHTPGLAHRSYLREFSTTENQLVMIPLSVTALTNARKPNFSVLIFSEVKAPTGNSAV